MSKEQRKQRGEAKDQVIFPQAETMPNMPGGYKEFICEIKNKISRRLIQTRINANADMITLYWDIG
jgi:hypothetical protein